MLRQDGWSPSGFPNCLLNCKSFRRWYMGKSEIIYLGFPRETYCLFKSLLLTGNRKLTHAHSAQLYSYLWVWLVAVMHGAGTLPCAGDTWELMIVPLISVSRAGNHVQFLSSFFISSALFHFILLCGFCSACYWYPIVMPLSEASAHSPSAAWEKLNSSAVQLVDPCFPLFLSWVQGWLATF